MTRRVFEIGGYVAGFVLIAFGIAALVLGIQGRETVSDNLKNEFIVGTPDMTPEEIEKEIPAIVEAQSAIRKARAAANAEPIEFTPVVAPDCTVANEPIDDGDAARCFARYLRIHALGTTNGLTYAQMGRFQAKENADPGLTDFAGGTSDPTQAVTDQATGQPVSNGARNLWVTATALSSALNLAYTAEQISLFGIVVSIALILAGVGFAVLSFATLRWLPDRRETA